MHHIYGTHPVRELLQAQPGVVKRLLLQNGAAPRLAALCALAERVGVAIEAASRQELHRRVGHAVHQGIVAEVAPFVYANLEDLLAQPRAPHAAPPLWLVLDQVQDPHNLGALIRSAYALGVDALMMAKDRACEVLPSVHKAAAGATAHLPIVRVTNLCRGLDALRQHGLWLIGTAPGVSTPVADADLALPTALVIGAEGQGLRRLVASHCDRLVSVPMTVTQGSLNASVAGAICLYEAARQRASAVSAKKVDRGASDFT